MLCNSCFYGRCQQSSTAKADRRARDAAVGPVAGKAAWSASGEQPAADVCRIQLPSALEDLNSLARGGPPAALQLRGCTACRCVCAKHLELLSCRGESFQRVMRQVCRAVCGTRLFRLDHRFYRAVSRGVRNRTASGIVLSHVCSTTSPFTKATEQSTYEPLRVSRQNETSSQTPDPCVELVGMGRTGTRMVRTHCCNCCPCCICCSMVARST